MVSRLRLWWVALAVVLVGLVAYLVVPTSAPLLLAFLTLALVGISYWPPLSRS